MTSLERANLLGLALCALGLMQTVGYVVGSKAIRAIGAATAASPLPKVFSDVDGLEPFASTFHLEGTTSGGERIRIPLTPELYQRLQGPYNRRNVYGAAIAFGPRLPENV